MATPIDNMRAEISIAQWKAAETFLDDNGGYIIPTVEHLNSLIGHGITEQEAELLADLARTIAKERNNV